MKKITLTNPESINRLLIFYLLAYFLVNLIFLTRYPFVHSDEAWLAGLTRNMMETRELWATESFFDLKPRYPHGFKTIYHILEMPFILLGGYKIFSIRLLSLIASIPCLLLFNKFLGKLGENNSFGFLTFLATLLLSLDIQFIYASHFARQEIFILLFLLAVINLLYKEKYRGAAILTGLSVGLHPNSFFIAVMALFILLPLKPLKALKVKDFSPLKVYFLSLLPFPIFFIGLSYAFDRNFISHYISYGDSEFNIIVPVFEKFMEFPYFLQKLWFQVSGTYYLPDIRLEMVLFAVSLIIAIILLLYERFLLKAAESNLQSPVQIYIDPPSKADSDIIFLLKGLAGLVFAIIILGRYNQTSIVFLFPLFFALIYVLLTRGELEQRRGKAKIALFALIIVVFISSLNNVLPWLSYSYQDYLDQIGLYVPKEGKVLANLNSEFYFANGNLRDYRNLSYLKENNMSIREYLENNQIEYIVYSDEMDLIYNKRPVWNMIYGNLRYMEDFKQFLEQNCSLLGQFTDNTYGVRIVKYMNSDLNFTVYIFKINDFSR